MKITDGKKTVEITMKIWDKARNEWKHAGENLADDFFNVGVLPVNDDGVYVVEDVEYCIDQANDWEQCTGDYCDDELGDDDERSVMVEEVC